ncbi:MAG: HupE/UreJ family protein [Phycisphaerae bacterium]
MKPRVWKSVFGGTLLGVLASTALAHPGHGAGGFGAGLLHPISGMDHLMTMLAVGMWSAQLGKKALWWVPVAFLACMIGGALAGMSGGRGSLSGVDQGIAASLMLAGLLVTLALRMPVIAAAGVAALFGVFHGYAHGAELETRLSAGTYVSGFVLTTVGILAAGLGTATLLQRARKPLALRLAGLGFVGVALVLLGGLS